MQTLFLLHYKGMKKLLPFLLTILLCACSGYKTTPITLPDGFTVSARVADTPEKIEKGLMFVTKLPEGDGMIFLMDQEEPQAFWMKNTLIDLDIIFIGADHTVNQAHEYVPHSYTYTPDAEVAVVYGEGKYVLELPAGSISRHGIEPGTQILFAAEEK